MGEYWPRSMMNTGWSNATWHVTKYASLLVVIKQHKKKKTFTASFTICTPPHTHTHGNGQQYGHCPIDWILYSIGLGTSVCTRPFCKHKEIWIYFYWEWRQTNSYTKCDKSISWKLCTGLIKICFGICIKFREKNNTISHWRCPFNQNKVDLILINSQKC